MCASGQLKRGNHSRNQKFYDWLQADMQQQPVDRVIGFNKMPGLDVYYAMVVSKIKRKRCVIHCIATAIAIGILPATSVQCLRQIRQHRF